MNGKHATGIVVCTLAWALLGAPAAAQQIRWVNQFGGTGQDNGKGIDLRRSGDLLVGGFTSAGDTISPPDLGVLSDRSPRSVDRSMQIGRPLRIRVRNADATQRLSAQLVRRLTFLPVRVVQVRVFVRVSVGPTIHRDRLDVSLGVEAIATKHARELLQGRRLEGRERCPVETVPAQSIEIASGLLAALNIDRMARGWDPVLPPPTTMLGGLYRYLREANPDHFQPMNANFGLLDPLEEKVRGGKRKRREAYSARALREIQGWADAHRPVPGDRTPEGP